ncbi:MAG: hypothetical protein BalsKO_19730 [Balneolaceae bacterium]
MKSKSFRVLIGLGILPLGIGFLGSWNWIFDVFSHFRVYYMPYFLVVCLVALGFKKKDGWDSIISYCDSSTTHYS